MSYLSTQNGTFLEDYQQFYVELINIAQFDKFNDEEFYLTGLTFRKLVREAVNVVVNNYYDLDESCDYKWNFHRKMVTIYILLPATGS